jgi:hypothetical protein
VSAPKDCPFQQWLPEELSPHSNIAWDANADIACNNGDAALLSLYLLLPRKPEPSVLKAIGDCLSAGVFGTPAPGKLILILTTKNGRPPKTGQPLAIKLIKHLYAPAPSRTALKRIANMLKPKGRSKWRLKFKGRRDSRDTGLNKSLERALRGHVIEESRAAGASPDAISSKLIELKLSACDRLNQLSVQYVRRAEAKKPAI